MGGLPTVGRDEEVGLLGEGNTKRYSLMTVFFIWDDEGFSCFPQEYTHASAHTSTRR